MDDDRAYAALLARAGRGAVPALARGLGLHPAVAADAFAATAGLVLAGLARHQARRGVPGAAAGVVEKYGRPADVDAPALAVEAHLARPTLDARLGGLLGDAAERVAGWLTARTGAPAETLARAMAASAPLALGALKACAAPDRLAALLEQAGSAALDEPASLVGGGGPCAHAFRVVRRGSRPLWRRLLRR